MGKLGGMKIFVPQASQHQGHTPGCTTTELKAG